MLDLGDGEAIGGAVGVATGAGALGGVFQNESRLDEVSEQLQIKEKILEIAREEARMIDIDRRVDKEIKKKEAEIEKSQ